MLIEAWLQIWRVIYKEVNINLKWIATSDQYRVSRIQYPVLSMLQPLNLEPWTFEPLNPEPGTLRSTDMPDYELKLIQTLEYKRPKVDKGYVDQTLYVNVSN